MSGTLIISPSAEFEQRVRSDKVFDTPWQRRWKEEYLRIDPAKVADDAAEEGVAVVCLGPAIPVDSMLELASAFDRDHPELCVVLVAEPSADLWREAARAGVRDVVSPEGDLGELARAVNRALGAAERRRSKVIGEMEAARRPSRVVTVLSPKGGSGKTTVATNLSVGLAMVMTGKVAIVDLDAQFGDVAAALQLSPSHSIADIVNSGAVDATMLKVFLSSHTSGLYALCAPESPAEGDEVTYDHAAQAVRLLAQEFPVVVVDTAAGIDERTLAAIELSTDLLLVCSTDVASVRSLRKEIEALDRLQMTAQRRHFVLNRADARVGLEWNDIESAVGMPVQLTLPSSRAVPLSMNVGSPVIESEPRSPVSRQLQRLVEEFTDRSPTASVAAAPRRRWREGR